MIAEGAFVLRTAWSLFLTGIFLGAGPCLLSCGPLLVSYIAGTKESPASGLKTYLIFSATRLAVYFLFGVLAGFLGEAVFHRLLEARALGFLYLVFGGFVFFVGLLLILEKTPAAKSCHWLRDRFLTGRDAKNIVLFGLIVSLAPCLPLISVLGFIALISDTWLKGVLFMTSFGLGTVASPLLLLAAGAGWVAGFSRRHERVLRALKVVCGAILVFLGVQLVASVF